MTWVGAARMAHARVAAGLPRTARDLEALARYPVMPSMVNPGFDLEGNPLPGDDGVANRDSMVRDSRTANSESLPDPGADAMGARHAGGGDTETAAALAVIPRSGTQRRKVLEALAASADGLTDDELAERTGLFLYSAAPRRVELRDGGWVLDSGRRRPTGRDAAAVVWVVSAAGREALR